MPIELGFWRLNGNQPAKRVHTVARLKQRFAIPDPT